MRLLRLTAGDIRIQWKSGFYGVYAIFTAVYILALMIIPMPVRKVVSSVMIFSDPAAMGLFFMGALILLEKGQGLNYALAVSPVSALEYCLAKILSLSLIGVIVALILFVVGSGTSIIVCLAAVLISSVLFSSCGLIAAEIAKTLNQFVLLSVPFELFIFVPPILLLFDIDYPFMIYHPGVSAIKLICDEADNPLLCFVVLIAWSILAVLLCTQIVKKHFLDKGGAQI